MKKMAFATLLILLLATGASAQVVQQSKLTFENVDPTFKLTFEHLGQDTRWLGVPPRDVTWSPDGLWIYFRWRENPESGQHPDTDPWYAASRAGTEVRLVPEAEAALIPGANPSWSVNRQLGAWSTGGTLFVWSRPAGTRAVFTSAGSLGAVSVSADGGKVFFATKGLGQASEESSDLWLYDVTAGHSRQVATVIEKKKADEAYPKWLKDQQLELIEIVRKRKQDKETSDAARRARELFMPQSIPVEKGARAVDIRPSPDGKTLSFRWVKDASRENRTHFMEFINESGYATDKTARPKVGEAPAEHKMGLVGVDPKIDPEKVEVTWVTPPTEKKVVIHGPYWNPAGTLAAVQILSMDHKDRWIAFLDVAAAKTTVVHHEHQNDWIGGPLVTGRWSPGFLEWLPDGSAFAFASEETGWSMLYLADSDGKVTRLTEGDWEVRAAELSPDGKFWNLATSREHPGEEQLYRIPARGGALERVTSGEGIHRSYVSPDGARVAALYETSKLMPDLYVMEARAGAEKKRVTKSGTDDYYRYAWIGSEIFSFQDAVGQTSWAEVWEQPKKPSGAAVLYVHGCGECAQAVDKGWRGIGSVLYANFMHQKGYRTASLDYRGSSGYGHANRTYAYRQMGVSDIDTAPPLVDVMVKRYGVDAKRVGIYGGSYGGFFTLMALFRHPGKFAAGVALYPVTDWAHYNQGYTNRILNGAPHEDVEAYRRSSPIYYAKGLRDALQIQHGLVDDNVQIQDSFRLGQVLMELKKDFDLVVYPMEDHGWDEVPARRDSYYRMTQWFDEHLLGAKETATPTSGSK